MNIQPRNPFYALLLVASVAFALTALVYAFPMDMMPHWLQAHGWKILLVEVAAVLVFGLASMGLDRLRQRKRESGIGNQESDSGPSRPQETLGG